MILVSLVVIRVTIRTREHYMWQLILIGAR